MYGILGRYENRIVCFCNLALFELYFVGIYGGREVTVVEKIHLPDMILSRIICTWRSRSGLVCSCQKPTTWPNSWTTIPNLSQFFPILIACGPFPRFPTNEQHLRSCFKSKMKEILQMNLRSIYIERHCLLHRIFLLREKLYKNVYFSNEPKLFTTIEYQSCYVLWKMSFFGKPVFKDTFFSYPWINKLTHTAFPWTVCN